MSDKRIRVYNPNKFDVGIMLLNGREQNVPHGSFVMLTQDDIDYIASLSKVFSKGYLRVEAAEEQEVLENLGINKEEEPNFMDDVDIKKKLALSAAKLGAWLDTIEDKVLLHRIADIAKENDIPASKMKLIAAKVPEVDD